MANDIFHVLRQMENENYSFFADMDEEMLKTISPYVLLMWTQGSSVNRNLIVFMTDHVCNTNFFSYSKHPKLQFMLMCYAIGGIDPGRWSFRKQAKSTKNKEKNAVASYFECSNETAEQYMEWLDKSDIKEILEIFEEKNRK